MKLIPILASGLLSLAAFSAQAQWQWVDADGRRVFSDRPPPAEVPEKNILKRPANRGFSPAPVSSAPPSPAPGAGPAGVDKALQDKRKQAEAEQTAKKKAEDDRNAQIRAENCARAQQAKAGFDSGVRIARMNERGEREFMDDASRAAEVERLQAVINDSCR